VCATPVVDGLEALALVARELEVDLAGGHNSDRGRLHDRHRPVVEVEQREAVAGLRQRLTRVRRVVAPQAGGGRLRAAEDGVDQLAPKLGAGVAELERR
jgi:hypothetical protein